MILIYYIQTVIQTIQIQSVFIQKAVPICVYDVQPNDKS